MKHRWAQERYLKVLRIETTENEGGLEAWNKEILLYTILFFPFHAILSK